MYVQRGKILFLRFLSVIADQIQLNLHNFTMWILVTPWRWLKRVFSSFFLPADVQDREKNEQEKTLKENAIEIEDDIMQSKLHIHRRWNNHTQSESDREREREQ